MGNSTALGSLYGGVMSGRDVTDHKEWGSSYNGKWLFPFRDLWAKLLNHTITPSSREKRKRPRRWNGEELRVRTDSHYSWSVICRYLPFGLPHVLAFTLVVDPIGESGKQIIVMFWNSKYEGTAISTLTSGILIHDHLKFRVIFKSKPNKYTNR